MKKLVAFFFGVCLAFSVLAWPKCEFFINKYGQYAQNCWDEPGPVPKALENNWGPKAQKGEVQSITKNPDGSISVTRTGDKGFYETYREIRPNHWERQ